MSTLTPSLPPKLAVLYDALNGRGEVPIPTLYAAVFNPGTAGDGRRDQQQWLGPYITKLNRRIKAQRLAVKPGQRKGTYALVRH